jgi:hypothetical protein
MLAAHVSNEGMEMTWESGHRILRKWGTEREPRIGRNGRTECLGDEDETTGVC